MWKNNLFNDVTALIADGRLSKAIGMLENHLLMNQRQGDLQQLQAVRSDYQLMVNYWRSGYADPQREQLFGQLQRRLYTLTTNMAINDRLRNNTFLKEAHQRPRQTGREWSVATIRQTLEAYVSNVAMLSLEPEHLQQQKGEQLYAEHQRFMSDLFGYIWTSRLWSSAVADAFESMLLSPTVDSTDQQLIVSAIMLSAMNAFGFQKFRVLVNVYTQTTDPQVRQRALVGWVFAMDADKASIYPELKDTVASLCNDKQTQAELKELQMQMLFCMSAEDDRQKIQDEIIPDIMKGNHLQMTHQGIIEQEDPMEDILHPDAAEQNIERMEQSMRRMIDMQKQGSDIYFAGFSQMKRFSFFNDISNWFVPFYPQHPGISHTWQRSRGSRFLHLIVKVGAFCDSDKYSFVLAFDQVLNRLPKQMLQMIEQGEATPMPIGGEVAIEEQRQPAFMRRLYLQNLYRFFRIFPQRSEFSSPFNEQDSIFFANPIFHGTALESQMHDVAAFLSKHRNYEAAMNVMENMGTQWRNTAYYLLMGSLLMRKTERTPTILQQAKACYEQALDAEQQNMRALAGYARACFALQDYEKALKTYQRQLLLHPEDSTTELNIAVCLTNLNRSEDALKTLYKLNYLDPRNENVTRALAWTLTIDGKTEQAERLYEQLMQSKTPQPEDQLNYGYCLWFSGNVSRAATHLQQFFAGQQRNGAITPEQELLVVERQLLSEHGISETDIRLMLDLLDTPSSNS